MSSVSRFTVQQEAEDVTVVTLSDAQLQETSTVTELQDALLEFVAARDPQKLIVDFRHVNQCSTAVINGLLRVKKRLVQSDGQLRLCEMKQHILDAFRMLNLVGSVFQVDRTLAEAIAELQGDSADGMA